MALISRLRAARGPSPAAGAHALALIALMVVATAPAADDERWRLRKREDGVVVHTRSNPGWNLEEFRGVTSVRAPLRAVVEMLMDADRYREWMHDCSEARSLEKRGIEEGRIYTVTDAPWPVSDRDVVIHWKLSQDDATGAVTILLESDAEALPPRDGHVRIPRAHGSYRFVPRTDGTVEVTYQFLSDPGGSLPGWLAGSWVVSIPFHSLRNLPGQLERMGYTGQSAEYATIRQPEP